jgi:hypothetical protein
MRREIVKVAEPWQREVLDALWAEAERAARIYASAMRNFGGDPSLRFDQSTFSWYRLVEDEPAAEEG